jgi:RimJ/RimL family protein N-acetyltransferase
MDSKTFDKLQQISVKDKYYKLADLVVIPLGAEYTLRPIDARSLFEKADMLMLDTFGQTERIKKYMPLLDFSKPNQNSEFFFYRLVQQRELGLGFSYAIRLNAGLLGIISIETPAFNKITIGFNHWTISFFVFESFENNGLMSSTLPRILQFLKTKLGVQQIYADVDPDNSRSIHLLEKFCFEEVDNNGWNNKIGGSTPRVFCCDLASLNFQKG